MHCVISFSGLQDGYINGISRMEDPSTVLLGGGVCLVCDVFI